MGWSSIDWSLQERALPDDCGAVATRNETQLSQGEATFPYIHPGMGHGVQELGDG